MSWRWRIAQYSELLWWRRYLSHRDKETYLGWKKAYWRRFQEQTGVEFKGPGRMLDAGCGPAGIFLHYADKLDVRVDALDPLIVAYEGTLAHFRRAAYPAVRFIDRPMEDLQLEQLYDCVYCLNAINHVNDLDRALSALQRALCSGGAMVLSVDVHRNRLAAALFRAIPGDLLHPHQYTEEEYGFRLRAAGFRVEWVKLYSAGLLFDYKVFYCRKEA